MCIVCGATFRDSLFDKGLLVDTGVDGLYGRSSTFEEVVQRFSALVERTGADARPEAIHFPPAMTRRDLEKSGYLKNFPDMAGTIHAFAGKDREHAALVERLHGDLDWTEHQAVTQVAMTPAACYPLYPVVARRGRLPAEGGTYDITGWVFRHEPSQEPTRMLTFRQREFVRIGTPEQVIAFRAHWLEKAQEIAERLELPYEVDVANDPFFGRAARMLKASQRDQELKFELLVPVNDGKGPTACMSFNYHQDHFGAGWDIRTHDGAIAHTACVGFGMERVTLALFKHHGLDVAAWPRQVRTALWG